MERVDPAVLICDLDGTILRVNSFPLWMLFLILGPLPGIGMGARIVLSLRVQGLLSRRKLRRIDHAGLMRGSQKAWETAGGPALDAAAARFRTLLRRTVRPEFEPLLLEIAAGAFDAVLATAAAGEYAIELGRQLGFEHVLTTPRRLTDGEGINSGARKLAGVVAFLNEREWSSRRRVLLTDHIDDLPLIRHSDAVLWFGPPRELARVQALAAGIQFVACRGPGATTLSRALAAVLGPARSPFAASSYASTSA
jgi:phosphoserine phosphatase